MDILWLSNLSSFKLIVIVILSTVLTLHIEYFATLRMVLNSYQAEKNWYLKRVNHLKSLREEIQDLRMKLKKQPVLPTETKKLGSLKLINDFGDGFRINKMSGKDCFQVIGLGDYVEFFDLVQKFDKNNVRIQSFLLKSNAMKKLSIYLKIGGV